MRRNEWDARVFSGRSRFRNTNEVELDIIRRNMSTANMTGKEYLSVLPCCDSAGYPNADPRLCLRSCRTIH